MVRLFDSGSSGGGGSHPPSYRHGGKVKKTGLAKLHKGEYVETEKEAKGERKGERGHRSHKGRR